MIRSFRSWVEKREYDGLLELDEWAGDWLAGVRQMFSTPAPAAPQPPAPSPPQPAPAPVTPQQTFDPEAYRAARYNATRLPAQPAAGRPRMQVVDVRTDPAGFLKQVLQFRPHEILGKDPNDYEGRANRWIKKLKGYQWKYPEETQNAIDAVAQAYVSVTNQVPQTAR